MDSGALADLEWFLSTGNLAERQAAALALTTSSTSAARDLLAKVPELAKHAAAGEPGWAFLAAAS